MHQTKLGPLDCIVQGPLAQEQPSDLLVVFCHGFGAPGTDLVGLTEEIKAASPVDLSKVSFVYPFAPMKLEALGGFDGRAWWLINMQALADMAGTNDYTVLRKSVPQGIIEAREMLKEALTDLFGRTGLGWEQLVLGGFSQGAMLTLDTVLNGDTNPAALIQMSGTLICEDQWREKISSHAGLNVLQSHGTIDPVLPFHAAEWLRDLFKENGCNLEFLPFEGVHTIPMEMVHRIAHCLGSQIDRSAATN